jgi:hypothetical protein
MKLFYSIAVCFLLAHSGFSQETGQKKLYTPGKKLSLENSTSKSTSCGVDTIVYPYLKETSFAAPADSFFVDAMVGSVRTAAQAYHINDELQIHGVQFWGAAYSTSTSPQTLQVRAYLYSVDANNMPLTRLDSADVTITEAYDFYEAIFATPYVYGQNFAVAVKSVPNDTLAVTTNNAGNVWSTPNYGESLAWRRFGSGTWNSTMAFFGQDLEYMIFPIVSYDITADFTSNEPFCTNAESEFNSTSSANLGNRMLNLNAFDAYWGIAADDSTLTWNYGPVQIGDEAFYTFTAAGTETISLTAEMRGYYTNCTDTYSEEIIVVETPIAQINPADSITMCDGEVIEVSAFPVSGVTYQWLMDGALSTDSINPTYSTGIAGFYSVITSNSCGSDTSDVLHVVVNPLPPAPVITTSGSFLISSPSGGIYQWYLNGTEIPGETNDSLIVLENGNYTVVVTNAFDCSSESVIFEVDDVSLNENSLDLISVFPNPSSGQFTIRARAAGAIVVSTFDGRIVQSEKLNANSEMSIDLSEYSSAVYFIRYSCEDGEITLRTVLGK